MKNKSPTDKPTHPSWGVIALSHISSTGTRLFLSPTEAHGLIRLTISHASLWVTDSQGQQPWPEAQIVEVQMSAVQFAELITQPNRGQGIACTLNRLGGESVEDCPVMDDDLDAAVNAGMERGVYESVRLLDEVIAQVKAAVDAGRPMGVAGLRTLLAQLGTARMRSGRDLDYWRKELSDRAGHLRAKVATDLHATADLIVRNMGLEALREKARALLPSFHAERADRVIDVDAQPGANGEG